MNLYFVVEGDRTELALYPCWINMIVPELIQVFQEKDVINNNYYMFSGGGIPSIYNHVVNAIKDINDNPVFDKLVVCLDSDEAGVERRKLKVIAEIEKSGVKLNNKCQLEFIIQNVCIETWLLGNMRIVKRRPEGEELKRYINHYNVKVQDPELMDKIEDFRNRAQFHFSYLREVFKEHKLTYSKSRPKEILEPTYFYELKRRIETTDHLPSLRYFFDFLTNVKNNLDSPPLNPQ